MKMSVEKIIHKEKTIYFSDYTGLAGEKGIEAINAHYEQHRKFIQEGANEMLFLTDVTDAIADRKIMKLLKEMTRENAKHTKQSAIIGVEGIQKVFVNSVAKFSKMNTKSFNSREEALDWLTE